MPVRKFRSVEEMERPPFHEPGSPEAVQSMIRVLELGARIRNVRYRPGVYKFHAAEEMFEAEVPRAGASKR